MILRGVAGRIVVGKHAWVMIEVLLMQQLLYNPAMLAEHDTVYYIGKPAHPLGAWITGGIGAHTQVVLYSNVNFFAILLCVDF